jgi:hypothetical protein
LAPIALLLAEWQIPINSKTSKGLIIIFAIYLNSAVAVIGVGMTPFGLLSGLFSLGGVPPMAAQPQSPPALM